ncbi:MAG TPA: CBS domain-containing protein [archaeon]|nr:CBS domain-containing protein [archaeon]
MGKTARDIMTRNVITVNEDMTINNLIGIFLNNKISCAPVVDKKNELIGIVTKTDVLGYFLDLDLDLTLKVGLKDILDSGKEYGELEIKSEMDLRVKDIMTPKPITARENTPIEKLAQTIIDKKIHRLVIKKGRSIVGLVSTLDLMYYIAGKNKK